MNNLRFQSGKEQSSNLRLPAAETKCLNNANHVSSAMSYRQWQSYASPASYLFPGGLPTTGGKFPIPRLSEGAAGSVMTTPGRTTRRHVSRACEFCRQRKTKCTGDASGCVNCQDAGIICCYTDSKKEKSKRQMNSLEAKISRYEKVLRIVGDWNGLSREELVNVALSEESSTQNDGPANSTRTSETSIPSRANFTTGPARVLDYTTVDYNLDDISRSTGYIGRSSEIHWMHALDKELDHLSKNKSDDMDTSIQSDPNGGGKPISSFNYNLDHLDISPVPGIEQHPIPSKGLCWNLFDLYRSSVHPSFPIIGLTPFTRQLESFLNKDMQPGSKWLSILHLIVAIASRHRFVTNRQWKYDQVDHFSHFLKAKALNIDSQVLSHPDMQQLQIEGLASFYLLAMGYVNRAWFLCGSALRRAFALGLHLRNVAGCTLDSREIRYRVWWSLYTLEHRLCMMTGRLSSVPDNILTTPLLLPFDECDFAKEEVQRLLIRSEPALGQPGPMTKVSTNALGERKQETDYSHVPPSSSLFFSQMVKVTFIAKKMSTKLYNPESVPSLWSGMKYAMRDLTLELEAWLMSIPKCYDFSSPQNTSSLAAERMSLALMFYSTKLAITRPCLGPFDPQQKGQQEDHEFRKKNALDCVESACHVIRLLPEPPNTNTLYNSFPWWSIIHFLMQSTVVLLIEASLGFEHTPKKIQMVSRAIKKSLEWMSIMSKTSATSERAQKLCEHFLGRLELQVDFDDFGVPGSESESDSESESPPPPRFNPRNSRRQLKIPETIAEIDPPLTLHTYQPNFSSSAGMLSASGTTAVPDAMDTDKPTNYSYADELLPYDQSTGLFTDSIFPPVDPTLDSNMNYPAEPML